MTYHYCCIVVGDGAGWTGIKRVRWRCLAASFFLSCALLLYFLSSGSVVSFCFSDLMGCDESDLIGQLHTGRPEHDALGGRRKKDAATNERVRKTINRNKPTRLD